jgi:hypothetical protein
MPGLLPRSQEGLPVCTRQLRPPSNEVDEFLYAHVVKVSWKTLDRRRALCRPIRFGCHQLGSLVSIPGPKSRPPKSACGSSCELLKRTAADFPVIHRLYPRSGRLKFPRPVHLAWPEMAVRRIGLPTSDPDLIFRIQLPEQRQMRRALAHQEVVEGRHGRRDGAVAARDAVPLPADRHADHVED